MDSETLDAPRPRMRVSGIHLLTGLALAVAAVWLLVAGFPVQVVSGPPVDLPGAASGVPVGDDAMEIAVAADGGCTVMWRPVETTTVPSVTELGRVIGEWLRDRPGTPVMLRIDRETSWMTVSVVLDTLRTHGAGTVWFVTATQASDGSMV